MFSVRATTYVCTYVRRRRVLLRVVESFDDVRVLVGGWAALELERLRQFSACMQQAQTDIRHEKSKRPSFELFGQVRRHFLRPGHQNKIPHISAIHHHRIGSPRNAHERAGH